MLAVAPDHAVGPGECLIVDEARSGVVHILKIVKDQTGNTEVEGILRYASDSGVPSNVLFVLKEVAQARVAAVVIEMQIVRDAVLACHPSQSGVDSGRVRCAE